MDVAHAENDRGHAAASGAAGRHARVPRIARHPGQRAVGDGLPAEFGHRGLADDDGTLLAQAGHCRRILRRRRVRGEPRSEPRGHAGDQKVVLDADRDAVEQAARRARHPARLGLASAPAGAFAIEAAPGIHDAVVTVDLVKHGIDRLDRREGLAPVAREQLSRRQEGDGIPGGLRYDAGVLRSHPIVSHDQRIVATAPRAPTEGPGGRVLGITIRRHRTGSVTHDGAASSVCPFFPRWGEGGGEGVRLYQRP